MHLRGLRLFVNSLVNRRVLREAKLSLENECEQLRRRTEVLASENIQLQREVSGLHSEKSAEISDVRAELKMKSFELTSLGTAFEEKMTLFRQSEMEVGMLREEVGAHK